MKVTVDRKPGSVVDLDIAADPEEFAEAVEKTYKDLTKNANIKGFRRGKAPRQVIERMIGRDAIVAEAGRGMLDDLYRQALEQEDLQPISEPEVDIYNEDPVAFRIVVEVFPTVELGDYKSVSVEPREVDVTDEEVDEEIEALLKNHSEWVEVPIARSPAEGDQVTIDLSVFDGDEPFQEPAPDTEFVIGESNLFSSLEEALKMMQPDTTSEVTLAFEEDDTSVRPELRGKTLRYVMTLKAVKTRKLPEFDDEFAAHVSEEFESAEALREEIRKDVLRRKAFEARNEIRSEIIEKMAETSEVAVPKTLIETEINDSIQNMQTRLAQQGLRFEDYLAQAGQTEEELREEMAEDAEKRVRQTLIMQEVWEAEGLELTEEDFEAEIDRLIGGQTDNERMRELYRSDYFRSALESDLHDRKLMERVVEIATNGAGAITGPGAELLEADENPEPEVEDDDGDAEAEDESSAEVATDIDAEAETEDSDDLDASASASDDGEAEEDDDSGDDAAADDSDEADDEDESDS